MSPRRDRVPMAVLRAGTWMVSCDVQPHQQKGGRRQQEINHRKQQDDSGEQSDVIWHPQPFSSPAGQGFLVAFITISASTYHRHHWALVGCNIELLTRGLFKTK